MPDEGKPATEPRFPASPTEKPRSFFLSNFTKGDWIALLGSMAAFLAFMGWIMDKVAAASVAEVTKEIGSVKTEMALVKDSVSDLETNLTAAFGAHTTAVDQAIDNGMEQRTDEIAKSLIAMFGDGNAVVVRVANVPMNEPVAMTAVNEFTTKFAAGTTLAMFGSKAVVEAVVDGMMDEKARSLQGMIETLDGYPDVQTDIIFADPEQLGALRAKFLLKEAQ